MYYSTSFFATTTHTTTAGGKLLLFRERSYWFQQRKIPCITGNKINLAVRHNFCRNQVSRWDFLIFKQFGDWNFQHFRNLKHDFHGHTESPGLAFNLCNKWLWLICWPIFRRKWQKVNQRGTSGGQRNTTAKKLPGQFVFWKKKSVIMKKIGSAAVLQRYTILLSKWKRMVEIGS